MDGKKFVMVYISLVISLSIILSIIFLIVNSVYGFSAFVLTFIFITIVIIAIIIGFATFILFYYGITKKPEIQNMGYRNNQNIDYHARFRSHPPTKASIQYSLDDIIDNKNPRRKP